MYSLARTVEPDDAETAAATTAGTPTARANVLMFRDPTSVGLLERLDRIARSDASALVIGETGTGKELIARHLHRLSARRGPFMAVNCGAFTESLIDAELFGHEAGAFTGALQSRAGWFEAANGGTLFLDEIGDLPLPQQVKLLRVLQERQVTRLGSRRAIPFDVRLVAATNVDLRQAVEAQRFRSDLYYRLDVAPIHLPPLRDRPGDILPLAQHFVGVYGPRMNRAGVAIAPDAQEALLRHPWPGNIRELENAIHFALIDCRDGAIRAADLHLAGHDLLAPSPAETDDRLSAIEEKAEAAAMPRDGESESDARHGMEGPVEDAVGNVVESAVEELLALRTPALFKIVEEALVRKAFAQSGDNQVKTARALGITRNTLRTLLKRHGLLADADMPVPDVAPVWLAR